MKTQRNILIAFILNLSFSLFEFVGGMFTGSVAIVSDAVHDVGDAMSIGISYFLERKSQRQPDDIYTYGYGRYSVMGSLITTLILLTGSALVVYNAVCRIISPTPIHYDGMVLFAAVGVWVNACAAFFTRSGDSLNQKAVNLHMLEDVLGWIVVLAGAVVMRFTDFHLLDPILSIGVAVFILINATKNLKEIADLFLEKTPHGIDVSELKAHVGEIHGVLDVHHMHVWSMDGQHHYATLHVVTDCDPQTIKAQIREELAEHHIGHVTIELETSDICCQERNCHVQAHDHDTHGHRHHHGHHHH